MDNLERLTAKLMANPLAQEFERLIEPAPDAWQLGEAYCKWAPLASEQAQAAALAIEFTLRNMVVYRFHNQEVIEAVAKMDALQAELKKQKKKRRARK